MSKSNILLSIGMIVRNEEKNLEKCLQALETLRKNVSCQLIVTDTGSTDRTVEIAEKYADVVNYFNWNDNFADARNFGLAEAKGKWFMFLDADEVFYDTKDIEEFFLSGEYKKYDNASYKIRNFLKVSDENDYVEQYVCRMFDMSKERKFTGRVHEYIPMLDKNVFLSSCIAHYSYASDLSFTEKEEKKERNLKLLLKCVEEEPGRVRFKYLLAQEYKAADDMESFNELVSNCYEELKEDENNPYFSYFLKYKAMQYKPANQETGIELLEKRVKRRSKKQAWDLDLTAVWADLLFLNKEYNKSLEACDKYFELYRKYVSGELEKGIGFTEAPPNFISESFKNAVVLLKIKNFLLLENWAKMGQELSALGFADMAKQELEEAAKLCCFYADGSKDFSLLARKYAEASSNEAKIVVATEIENFALRDSHILKFICKAFVEEENSTCMEKQDEFMLLQEFRHKLLISRENVEPVIEKYIAAEKFMPMEMCSEIVSWAVITGSGSAAYVAWIEHDAVQLFTKKIFNVYGDLIDIIAENVQAKTEKMKKMPAPVLYFALCITEIALLTSRKQDIFKTNEVFEFYVTAGYEYLTLIYREEVLTAEGIVNLGRSSRFLFWAKNALDFKKKGELENVMACFKEAVRNYPVMSETVKTVLDSLTAEPEPNKEEQARNEIEFKYYAKKIKDKIMEINGMGMRDEAIQLLDSYRNINPGDKEGITELERNLGIDN